MRGSAAGALIYSKAIFLLKHRKKVLPAVKFNIRNLMGGLVIIVVLAFVFLRGDQINELAATMAQGARHGLNPYQAHLLGEIASQDGQTIKELAYHLCVKPSNFKPIAQPLEERGLIERRQDENDKRSFRIYLTEKGRAESAAIVAPAVTTGISAASWKLEWHAGMVERTRSEPRRETSQSPYRPEKIMFAWVTTTPFGREVVPDVKII